MKGYKFNENGEMVKSDVFIVWGSPASGKTTYVRNNMSEGDMVIDLDFIKQSLSLADKTETKDNLLETALSVREHLYKLIEQRNFTCDNVWVVAGLPTAEERLALQERLRGKLIHIDATYEECIARAMNDGERKDKEKQIQVIDRWHRLYNYE